MTGQKEKKQITLTIQGMTCDGCARHVEDALRQVPGVEAVQVPGWQSGQAVLSADPDVDESALVQAVAQAGYRAVPAPSEPSAPVQKGEADFDLIVIGTGGGGMAAAIRAAELGFRAAIIEGGTIGGTCVNIGCVPSKTLIRAAAVYHQAGHHRFAGLRTRAEGVDWPALIRQKDELVASLRQGKYVDVLASYSNNVTLIRGWASLKPGNRVVLDDGRVFSAAKIVIATGARPAVLPLPGIDQVDVLTSTTAMSLDKQPQSLIVLGGRAVALELGQAFARLGTQVTILQRSERIIPSYEPEIADTLTEALQAEGIAVHTGVSLQAIRVENGQKVVTAEIGGQTRQFRAEQVLMAVGRTPNTDRLGLDEVGVAVDERGFIQVNDHQQTTNPDIYAVGDVTTRPKLVYVAAAAGGIAATNALTGQNQSLDLAVLPEVIFTDPQVARVGITEAEARARGYNVRTTILPLEYVPRALAARDTRGLVKLVADAGSNRLLGAQVLAAEAGEVIQTAAMAVRFGLQFGFTIDDLTGMLFPYLTQVEGLKLAAQTFEKDVAQLSCCAG